MGQAGISRPTLHLSHDNGGTDMVALIALVLILAVFGGLGFAAHVLWLLLIAALVLWLVGFFIGGATDGGRRWYGR